LPRLIRQERVQERTAPLVADSPDRESRSRPNRGIRRGRGGSEQALIEGAAVLELNESRLRLAERGKPGSGDRRRARLASRNRGRRACATQERQKDRDETPPHQPHDVFLSVSLKKPLDYMVSSFRF
jgi:hypothetical protein